MSVGTSVQFTTDVTYYDGRPNFLGISRCTVVNGDRVIAEGRGRVIQFLLRDVVSVSESPHSAGKEVYITTSSAGLKFSFPNPLQANWLHVTLRHAMAGTLPEEVPDLPPGDKDRSQFFGNLGFFFAFCIPPLGLLFSILSINHAKRNYRAPVRGILGVVLNVITLVAFVVQIANSS